MLFPPHFSRLIEVHSPDAKHTVVLRSKDSATAQAWFNAIHSSVNELIPRVIAEVRDQLGKTGIAGSREIRHLGWLAEKVTKTFLFSFLSSLFLTCSLLLNSALSGSGEAK